MDVLCVASAVADDCRTEARAGLVPVAAEARAALPTGAFSAGNCPRDVCC